MSTEAASSNRSPYWWRTTYYRDFAANQKKGLADFKRADMGWLNYEASAWLYEIVRRCNEAGPVHAELPGYPTWPPFPELHTMHQVALTRVIDAAAGHRQVAIPGLLPKAGSPALVPGFLPKAGYSEAIPGYSFDLRADDQTLANAFMGWIEEQREKLGVIRGTGKKGTASHHRRDLPRNLDWRWVEILDHTKGQGTVPLTETQRGWRRDARKYAKTFHSSILSAFSQSDSELNTLLAAQRMILGEGFLPEKIDLQAAHAASDTLLHLPAPLSEDPAPAE